MRTKPTILKLACLAMAMALFGGSALATDWVNVASELGVAGGEKSSAVSWTDYDGDGLHDLFVTNWLDSTRLYRNTGGTFEEIYHPLYNVDGGSNGAAWGDFDNDGLPDLYLPIYDTENLFILNEGAGAFSDGSAASNMDDPGDGTTALWADYDQDGLLDVYLLNTEQYANQEPNRLFRNLGDGSFADVTDIIPGGNYYSFGGAWADYDNDGDPDLFITNSNASDICRLFENQGDGSFTDVTVAPLLVGDDCLGVSWCDYDNDGWMDLFIARSATHECLLFHNDGESGGFFTEVAAGTDLEGNGHSYSPQWADVDNDGWADLFLTDLHGANKLFMNNGDDTFTTVIDPPLNGVLRCSGSAWCDFDSDGDLDLYVALDQGIENQLLRNDLETGNHWLQLDLQGTTSNRPAIGARVRIVAGGIEQIREVSGNSGFHSQNALTLAFGLGGATTIDEAEVTWPSGLVQTLTGLAVDERQPIVETFEPVVASFSATPLVGDAPLEVTFTNESTGDMPTYLWDFGNGDSSVDVNPIYTYPDGGIFTVTLTVTGPQNTVSATETIMVYDERPVILAVVDVPEDQGREVRVEFLRSSFDTDSLRSEMYSVQRLDDGVWWTVNSGGAYGASIYRFTAPTRDDNEDTTFRVIAHMDEGNWASDSVVGYSVDNIAPDAPIDLLTHWNGLGFQLNWTPPIDNDVAYYRVYRESEGILELLGESEVTSYFYETEWNHDHHLLVTAVDDGDNEGEPTEVELITAVAPLAPAGFALMQNNPNPFNPSTEINFALPESADVRLTIYDPKGRIVRKLIDGSPMSAGNHGIIWDGRDGTGRLQTSGIYFYRIEAGDRSETRKMTLLK